MVSSRRVFGGLIWQFLQNSGSKIVSFIVSIVLARLLLPSDYGVLAIVSALVGIFDVFITNGFGGALIQKKDADETDCSTVFYFQLVFSIGIYAALFFLAPVIADFYGEGYEILGSAIRVLGLNVIALALGNVHLSLVSKRMQFKLSFYATLVGTILSAVLGIAMALKGFGVWALVAQSLSASVFHTIVLWLIAKWRPKLLFSFARLKILFSYGWKLMCVGLLENLYLEIRSLIIGKKYSSQSLAYYNKGETFPKLISVNINSSIKTVFFSAIALEQDDKVRLKNMTKRAIQTSSYIMFPTLVGLMIIADNLIPLLLTEKWIPSIPYLRIFCLVYCVRPIQTTNVQVYKGIGKAGINLYLEAIKKAVGIILLLGVMNFGPYPIACAYTVSSVINAIISALPNKKIIDYGLGEQLKDMLPNMLLSLSFVIPTWQLGKVSFHPILVILIQIAAAALIYIGLSELIKNKSYVYMKSFLFSRKKC